MKIKRLITPLIFFIIGMLVGVVLTSMTKSAIANVMKPSGSGDFVIAAVLVNQEIVYLPRSICEIFLYNTDGDVISVAQSVEIDFDSKKRMIFDGDGILYIIEEEEGLPERLWKMNLPNPKLIEMKLPEIPVPDDTGRFLNYSLSNYSTSVILVFEKKLVVTDLVEDSYEVHDFYYEPREDSPHEGMSWDTYVSHTSNCETLFVLDQPNVNIGLSTQGRIYFYDIPGTEWTSLGQSSQGGQGVHTSPNGEYYVVNSASSSFSNRAHEFELFETGSNSRNFIGLLTLQAQCVGDKYLLAIDYQYNAPMVKLLDFSGHEVLSEKVNRSTSNPYYHRQWYLDSIIGAIYEVQIENP